MPLRRQPCIVPRFRAIETTPLLRAASLALLLICATPALAGGVVSLDLCMDWLVAHHLPRERVAALSPLHRQFPAPWIGRDWPSHDGSLEQVYALRAERILVGEYAATLLRRRLVELHQPVTVLPLPQTLDQVVAYERQFLAAVGLPEERAGTPKESPREPDADAPRLLLLGANGIATGTGTLEDEIIRRAGWRNYLEAPGFHSLDLEQLVVDPPQAILWTAPPHRALANQFAEHRALRRSLAASRWLQTDVWRWECPGPWTWELIGQLSRWND